MSKLLAEEAFYSFFGIDADNVPTIEVQSYWKEFLHSLILPDYLYINTKGHAIGVFIDGYDYLLLLKKYASEGSGKVDIDLSTSNLLSALELEDEEELKYLMFSPSDNYDTYELYQW